MSASVEKVSFAARMRKRTRAWARRRHGIDTDPMTILTRRVYILPTRLGLFYAGMLFLMFLGSMNYANNLGLGLTFILGSIGLVAMHHCQRNLAGLKVSSGLTEPVFAGQLVRFAVAFENDAVNMRYEIRAAAEESQSDSVNVNSHDIATALVEVASSRRGRLRLDHLQISTTYPFGLFRAWTHVHIPMSAVVYPRPADRGDSPPSTQTDVGGSQSTDIGDEDFAGLRGFAPGDSPRRVAWKAFARGQSLQVKQYAGTAVASHVFDWESLNGLDVELRLARLARWIEDAFAAERAYGLRLPDIEIPTNVGPAHRQRCLTALALFGLSDAYK